MDHLSLIQLRPGESGRVKRIVAGAYATKKLYEMGFNTNAVIQVLKNDRGPIVVSLAGNKIALGRGLADKVIVSRS